MFGRIKVRGPLAERCAEFAWKGCKLAASGDFETITFADEPERQPGFLIKVLPLEPQVLLDGLQLCIRIVFRLSSANCLAL